MGTQQTVNSRGLLAPYFTPRARVPEPQRGQFPWGEERDYHLHVRDVEVACLTENMGTGIFIASAPARVHRVYLLE